MHTYFQEILKLPLPEVRRQMPSEGRLPDRAVGRSNIEESPRDALPASETGGDKTAGLHVDVIMRTDCK